MRKGTWTVGLLLVALLSGWGMRAPSALAEPTPARETIVPANPIHSEEPSATNTAAPTPMPTQTPTTKPTPSPEPDESALRARIAELEVDLRKSKAENVVWQEKAAALNRYSGVTLPITVELDDTAVALEVGGQLYIGRRDGTAQGILREYTVSSNEAGKEITSAYVVAYLFSLLPTAGTAEPTVTTEDVAGGTATRFAQTYTDTDGIECYGTFAVLECAGRLYCLEVQSLAEEQDAANALMTSFINGLTFTRSEQDP